jgi:sporadic carbohydrate cluster protein (TIGR04323 family)
MSTGANRKGYRGYICARMGCGRSAPQHLQQLVMRDYCAKKDMEYLLAATEYCMPGCTMILDAVLLDLEHLEGIVMYSLYLFPEKREKRMAMYKALIDKGCSLHAAAEGIVIRTWDDARRIEDTWLVKEVMDEQDTGAIAALRGWDAAHAGS